jgi:predicted RNA binding protein YcfA (HicA-like mRNA interferase family)
LPRDLSGHELANLLRRYGYEETRQTGSHIRLKSKLRGADHQVTVPDHKTLKLGTLNAIVGGREVSGERPGAICAGVVRTLIAEQSAGYPRDSAQIRGREFSES